MTTDTFNEIAHLVFGGGLDEVLVSKDAFADQRKKERNQARVGLATNVIGITAGTAATAESLKRLKDTKRGAHVAPLQGVKAAGKLRKLKVPALLAAGAGLGLQSANLGGDFVANRVLSRAAKDEKKNVSKANPDQADYGNLSAGTKGKLVLVGHAEKQARKQAPKVKRKLKELSKAAPGGRLRPIPAKPNEVAKAAEILWEGEFSKFDMDKQQVFGWASIVKKDGEDIVDLQGDYISIDEIEKSAYDYVVKSRKGGNQHQRNGDAPYHVSDMIESFIVTPEKIEKMGLPDDTPLGWWVGYQINDSNTWDQVKTGKRTGFSIHGRGRRESV